MNEVKFLMDQIKTTFNGDSWHGPNLVKSLLGIEKEQASTRVIWERHTIWELTDHVTYWLEEVHKSVKSKKDLDHSGNDWPKMGATEEDWKQSLLRLEAAVNMLVDELSTWRNSDLAENIPGNDYTFKQMLHGIIHHNLYHVGQINILRQKD